MSTTHTVPQRYHMCPIIIILYISISFSCKHLSCLCVIHPGKLGHGDTNRVYRPKVIEALHGFIVRKVCAGSQSSLALTSAGQVSFGLLIF